MEKVKVAAVSALSYGAEEIQNAVDNLLEQLGGIEKFVPHKARVFVKANLVRDMPPDKAATTHPQVLIALIRRIKEVCGAEVTVGDSSGGAYTKGFMTSVYSKCGMLEVAEKTGCKLNENFDFSSAAIGGKVLSSCDITRSFLDADVVINVGKLKTHSFAGYTGAVKNLFGLVPGLVKVEMHSRFPELYSFCDMLVDIERYASRKITLHVLDAVMGMDGDGPTNGKPKFMGKIIASPDAYAADAAAVSLFGNPMAAPLLKTAAARGLIAEDLSSVDFDFAKWKNSFISDFSAVEAVETDTFLHMPRWIKQMAKKHLTKKVKIVKSLCRGCGKCAAHCPAEAVKVVKGKARVSQSLCIRCYCCQELCPFDAVKFGKPIAYRVVRGFSRSKKTGKR